MVKKICILAPILFGIFSLLLQNFFFLHTRSDGSLFHLAILRAKTKEGKVIILETLSVEWRCTQCLHGASSKAAYQTLYIPLHGPTRQPWPADQRVWNNTILKINRKRKLYQAGVLSTFVCGSETWTIYSLQERRLGVFHLCCLKRFLSITSLDHFSKKDVFLYQACLLCSPKDVYADAAMCVSWMTAATQRTFCIANYM